MSGEPLLAVVGPTASGKSALALALAEVLGGELVSVDSAQVFRGLDVGTAKPSAAEQALVRHHLIDVLEPTEQWSAADFARAADAAIQEIRGRGRVPVLCGGTGLWLRALVHGLVEVPPIDPALRGEVRAELARRGPAALHAELAQVDPALAARLSPGDPQRIGRALEVYRQTGVPLSRYQEEHGFRPRRHLLVAVGLAWPRDQLAARISQRTRRMYAAGLLEETRRCLERGVPPDAPGLSIIGYADAVRHLAGSLSRAEAEEATEIATRQYAKRQRNWFRGVAELEWIRPEAPLEEVRAGLERRLSCARR